MKRPASAARDTADSKHDVALAMSPVIAKADPRTRCAAILARIVMFLGQSDSCKLEVSPEQNLVLVFLNLGFPPTGVILY